MNRTILLAALAATALSSPLAAQIAPSTRPQQRTSLPAPTMVDPSVATLRDAALKDEIAYDIVEGLTTEVGPRLAGTEAEARARAWGVVKLKALGFKNVHIETYQMPVWVRGEETAEVVSPFPQKMRLTALGNSGATPAGGLVAEIVYFPSFADLQTAPEGSLKGKIAFVSNAMVATQDGSTYGQFGAARFTGPNVAAQKGAAAIVIRSIGSDHGRGPHAGLTNFAEGVTPIPAAALSTSDADNLSRMVARGKPIKLRLVLTPRQTGTHESGNVIAEVPGSDAKAGIVLIGGHLDSWDLGTGAIDDGAGVAITAAAGDIGYGVQFPASSQYVTAVGGTSIQQVGNGSIQEVTWPLSGSGCSQYIAKPAYQTDNLCTMRTVNDVAVLADPSAGLAVYDSILNGPGNGGWAVVGGTSMGAPIVASMYALATAGGTPSNAATLYASYSGKVPAILDVTSGSDGTCSVAGLCNAGPGYDAPSGVGVPWGVAAFTPNAAPTSPPASSGSGPVRHG